jgi:hypothetical protein
VWLFPTWLYRIVREVAAVEAVIECREHEGHVAAFQNCPALIDNFIQGPPLPFVDLRRKPWAEIVGG